MKRIGQKFIRGQFQDMLKVAAPARFHSPNTYLELNAWGVCLCATHLAKAAAAESPLERLKWVCGFYIGGQHRSPTKVGARIPFNPILGETLQLIGPNQEMFYAE